MFTNGNFLLPLVLGEIQTFREKKILKLNHKDYILRSSKVSNCLLWLTWFNIFILIYSHYKWNFKPHFTYMILFHFYHLKKTGEKIWIIKSILIQMQTFIRFFVRLWWLMFGFCFCFWFNHVSCLRNNRKTITNSNKLN